MTARALRVLRPLELTQVSKDKAVSTRGWHVELVRQHLVWHLSTRSKKWCGIECMASTMFGRNTEANRRGARERIAKTFRALLKEHDLFMLIDYSGERGSISAVKLLETEVDKQSAEEQLKRMRARREVSQELLEDALRVIGVDISQAGA